MLQLRDPTLPDQMTGLASRRTFLARAREMLADPAAEPAAALILADIDDCKRFNDCFSHMIGDELIRLTARIFAGATLPGDVVARVGGDAFALFAPRLTADGAAARAEALRARVERTPIITQRGLRAAKISVGVAMASGADPEALLAAAEAALFEAKRAGRNRVWPAPAA